MTAHEFKKFEPSKNTRHGIRSSHRSKVGHSCVLLKAIMEIVFRLCSCKTGVYNYLLFRHANLFDPSQYPPEEAKWESTV